MEVFKPSEKWRWFFACLGAAGLLALTVALFRNPVGPLAAPVKKPEWRAVTLISSQDAAVNDEAILLDPTPLFLPTKWNATQRAIGAREAGGKFQGFDAPKWNFAEHELKLGLPAAAAVPAGAVEAVAVDSPTVPLLGVGRTDAPDLVVAERRAFLEIVVAGTGKTVLKTTLSEGPQATGAWMPLEFVAAVDAAGMIGPLVLTVRSGVEGVDGFFAKHIAATLRIGERLAPGFYRISVGP